MAKHPITFSYIIFYALFLPDSWQVLSGILASCLITPRIIPTDYDASGRIMLYIMVAVIGYAASRPLGKGISNRLKKWIIGQPQKM